MSDKVFLNGNIYCVNPQHTWAEAVAIDDKKIIAVGKNEEIEAFITPTTEVVDLKGNTVIPGLHDMHIHALMGAYSHLNNCNLPVNSNCSLEEILKSIRKYADENPDTKWITGGSWQGTIQHQLHKKHLDLIEPERPIFLFDFSQHNAWVNSKALEIAGINKNTPDPEGGVIVRDNDGEPTGVLLESANRLVYKHIVFTETHTHLEAANKIIKDLNKYGITSIKDPLADKKTLETYNKLEEEQNLTMRIAAYLPWKCNIGENVPFEEQLNLIENREQYETELIKTNFAKMFIDGVPAFKTASFIELYIDDNKNSYNYLNLLLVEPEQFKADLIKLDKQGITVMMHATGDAAIRVCLDAIEAVRKENGNSGNKHEIAHTNFVNENDFQRFRELDTVAEFSPPFWAPSATHEKNIEVLGENGADKAYPIKSIKDLGALSVYGSDYMVIPDPNPWYSFESMITREDPTGEFSGALNKEEGLNIFEAIEVFTINGAKSMYLDHLTGSLEVGKFADMIVLNQNIFEVDPKQIHNTEVLMTVFNGEIVFEKKYQSL